jgi:hypothetical protein
MPYYNIRGPFLGVNKAKDPSQLKATEAQDALNVLLSSGTLRKRPGWVQRLNFVAPVLGLYDFLKVDTTNGGVDVIHFVKAGAQLYAMDNWVAESMQLAMSSTELADFETVNNKVYFCDSTMFKVTEGDTDPTPVSYDAQITAPTACTATETVNGGNLDGDYDYKNTFYSTAWGQESASSPASGVASPDGKTVELTSIDNGAGADARVDKVKIYRRKVSALETDWHYVDSINKGTTSYTDDIKDVDVDPLDIAPLSSTDTLPNFRFLAQQADVLFATGADKYPTRLYYTLPGQPWALYQYLEVGTASDTDLITGLAAFQGVLVVFKEKSIWILSGNSLDTFYLRKVIPGVGCRSHHSIVPMGNVLLFLSEDGFYAFDGASAANVSGLVAQDPIGPDIRARNYARDRYCTGVYDPDNSVVLWSYSSADATANDSMVAFFPEHSKLVGFPSWCPWDMGAVTYMARLSDPTSRERITHFGFSDGPLGYFGSEADNTVPFQWFWKTGQLEGDIPSRWKAWKELAIDFEPQPQATTATVKAYLDNATTGTTVGTHDQTTATYRGRVSDSAKRLALEVSGTTDQAAEAYSMLLEFEVARRA